MRAKKLFYSGSYALRLLQNHGWPGNIREFANVMRRAVVVCPNDIILPGPLNDRFQSSIEATSIDLKGGVSGAAGFLMACERFLEQASANLFDRLAPSELERLLLALHGIEAAVITAQTGNGVPVARRVLKESKADDIKNL